MMKVQQIMKQPARTCQAHDCLETAARMMWESDCGSLPVVDPTGRALGMLTDRDICMAALHQSGALHALEVRNAMSSELYACGPDDPVAAAEETMRARQVRRLPVLNAEGHVVGILSLNDLALEAEAQPSRKQPAALAEVGRILGAIGKHRSLAAAASA